MYVYLVTTIFKFFLQLSHIIDKHGVSVTTNHELVYIITKVPINIISVQLKLIKRCLLSEVTIEQGSKIDKRIYLVIYISSSHN